MQTMPLLPNTIHQIPYLITWTPLLFLDAASEALFFLLLPCAPSFLCYPHCLPSEKDLTVKQPMSPFKTVDQLKRFGEKKHQQRQQQQQHRGSQEAKELANGDSSAVEEIMRYFLFVVTVVVVGGGGDCCCCCCHCCCCCCCC